MGLDEDAVDLLARAAQEAVSGTHDEGESLGGKRVVAETGTIELVEEEGEGEDLLAILKMIIVQLSSDPVANLRENRHDRDWMAERFTTHFQAFRSAAALLIATGAGVCLVLSGCAMETFAPETAPENVVIHDFSPFYRLGPQQGKGPDASLRTGTRVKLLRREMGYSLVQLGDLRSGYVANENMAVAPPRPPEQVRQEAAIKKAGGRWRAETSPVYSGPQINDTPLPDPNIPPPDLNVEPEVIPDNLAVPAGTPRGAPKFRY